jgi:chromosome segregation ATPase
VSWEGIYGIDRKLDAILKNQTTIFNNLSGLKAQGEKLMADFSALQATVDKLVADVTAILAEISALNQELTGTAGDQAAVDAIKAKIDEQTAALEAALPPPPPTP